MPGDSLQETGRPGPIWADSQIRRVSLVIDEGLNMLETSTGLSSRKLALAGAFAAVTAILIFFGVPSSAQKSGPLQPQGQIELPAHRNPGGFDHADVHPATGRVFIAHTVNDALDIIDGSNDRFLRSIENLKGIAGALVAPGANLIFTSNRGENTIAIFPFDNEAALVKVPVGASPNGLAYDPKRNLLLAGQGGDPVTVAIVDVAKRNVVSTLTVPGRTRWTIFDERQELFFVNVSDPPVIVGIQSSRPGQIARTYSVPAAGPHGLDLDSKSRRLFCACDAKKLVALEAETGKILQEVPLSGVPDVIFANSARRHLYAAIGDPGVIEVFDMDTLKLIQTVPTGSGAHTMAFDPVRNKVYALLPQTHGVAVFVDQD
jgi:DNA-binding beta-propeller fold protein YncE